MKIKSIFPGSYVNIIGRSGLTIAIALATAGVTLGQSIQIQPSVLSAGGGQAQTGSYSLSGTLGQTVVGTSHATTQPYTVLAGFWGTIGAVQIPDGPQLTIQRVGQRVVVSWPRSAKGYRLQSTPVIGVSAFWQDVNQIYQPDQTSYSVTLPIQRRAQFFRLVKP